MIDKIKMLVDLFPYFEKLRKVREIHLEKISIAKQNQYWPLFFDLDDEGIDLKFKFPGTEFTIGILYESLKVEYKESKWHKKK